MTITKVENIESSDDIKSNDDGPRNGTIEINERNVENEDEAIERCQIILVYVLESLLNIQNKLI